MKRHIVRVSLICALAAMMPLTSCIGSFKLTNKMLGWNRHISNKFVNELVFVAFWVLPVYEVCGLADLLVINSIEFWSGENPIAANTRTVDTDHGRYQVQSNAKGYRITAPDGAVTVLNFDVEKQQWSADIDGTAYPFLTFVDDTHVSLPLPDGTWRTYATTSDGLYAYRADATPVLLASR